MGTLRINRTGEGMAMRDDLVEVDVDEGVIDASISAPDGETLPGLPNCFRQADGSVIQKLDYPFSIKTRDAYGVTKEQQHASVHHHRLKGEHLIRLRAASGETGNVVALACSLRLPDMMAKAIYDKMDALDLDTASLVIENFTQRGPTTGQ